MKGLPKSCLPALALYACTLPTLAQDLLNDPLPLSGETLHLRLFSDPSVDPRIISMTTRPDDPVSLYVTTQAGSVYQVAPDGNSTEWFDYDAAVTLAVPGAADGYVLDSPTNPQGGLRAVAFHPLFEANGKFYTSAMVDRPTNTTGINYLGSSATGLDFDGLVAEWTYDHDTGTVDASSYRELFRVQVTRLSHALKQIAFNPFAEPGDADFGLLYIAHGDAAEQQASAGGGQNTGDALGKTLRVDPLQDGSDPYTTPGNPFVGVPGTLDEIYTLGHRNPHNFSFAQDSNGNSQLILAEIGRDNIEEVNLLLPGGNYGWSQREGTFVHLSSGGYINGVDPLPANEWQLNDFIYPAAQYDHIANPGQGFVGAAIAGGFVLVNGSDKGLDNQYVFADFGSNSGHVYHADFTDMLGAHTQLADGELPGALTQAAISRLSLTLDSDGDGTVDATANDLNTLLGLGRNDVRFGRGTRGEMYISSKQNGLVYLVTNTVPQLVEPEAAGFASVVRFATEPGLCYTVMRSSDGRSYVAVATYEGTGRTETFVDQVSGDESFIYRVDVQ